MTTLHLEEKEVFLQLNKYVCLKEETQGVFTQGNFHLDELLVLPGLTFTLEVLFTLTENALFNLPRSPEGLIGFF